MMDIEDEWTRMESEDAGRKFSGVWGPRRPSPRRSQSSVLTSSVLHNFTDLSGDRVRNQVHKRDRLAGL